MRNPEDEPIREYQAAYEVFIATLSILSIINLVLLAVGTSVETDRIISVMNGVLSFIFILDFVVRLRKSRSWKHYLFRDFGWADLLASLPIPQIKALKVFRLFRFFSVVYRLGLRGVARSLLRDRFGSSLLMLALAGILLVEFGSLIMLSLERGRPGATINTASDAMWYIFVTVSTVGYGDTYPVSAAGRLFGIVVIAVGVGLFATFTGYLARIFVAGSEDRGERL